MSAAEIGKRTSTFAQPQTTDPSEEDASVLSPHVKFNRSHFKTLKSYAKGQTSSPTVVRYDAKRVKNHRRVVLWRPMNAMALPKSCHEHDPQLTQAARKPHTSFEWGRWLY